MGVEAADVVIGVLSWVTWEWACFHTGVYVETRGGYLEVRRRNEWVR